MSLWAVLLTGLFAGGASCAASRAGCWPRSWPAAAASPSPSQRGGAPARGGRLPSLYRQRCGINAGPTLEISASWSQARVATRAAWACTAAPAR